MRLQLDVFLYREKVKKKVNNLHLKDKVIHVHAGTCNATLHERKDTQQTISGK